MRQRRPPRPEYLRLVEPGAIIPPPGRPRPGDRWKAFRAASPAVDAEGPWTPLEYRDGPLPGRPRQPALRTCSSPVLGPGPAPRPPAVPVPGPGVPRVRDDGIAWPLVGFVAGIVAAAILIAVVEAFR